MNSNPVDMYRLMYRNKTLTSFSTRMSMLNQAPLAALGWGPRSWRAAELAPRQQTKLYGGAARQLGGMAIGMAAAPVLDYMSNNVFKEPATWGHALTKIGKGVVQGGSTGAFIGFGAGTATTGAGGVPGAAIGALIGGIIGGVHGIVDTLQDVKQYELRTAEDLKRYNDQIRSNWRKIADAFPKAQTSIELRRGAETAQNLVDRGDLRGMKTYQALSRKVLDGLLGERDQVENEIMGFKPTGDKFADTLRGSNLLKRLDELNLRISGERAGLRIVEDALGKREEQKKAEDAARAARAETLSAITAQGEISRESRETSLLAQFGTKSQLEDALAGFAFRMRVAASSRDKALARA